MDSWSWRERECDSLSRRSLRAQALEQLPPVQLLHSLAAPPCLPLHWWQSQGRSTGQLSVGRVSQRIYHTIATDHTIVGFFILLYYYKLVICPLS